MFMIIYLLAVMIATPPIYNYWNQRTLPDGRNVIAWTGLPAYAVTLIICGVEALFGLLVIPSDFHPNLWNLLIFTALIYLGNQIVFNFAVKLYSKARTAVVRA